MIDRIVLDGATWRRALDTLHLRPEEMRPDDEVIIEFRSVPDHPELAEVIFSHQNPRAEGEIRDILTAVAAKYCSPGEGRP